jgi:hypothetical protein
VVASRPLSSKPKLRSLGWAFALAVLGVAMTSLAKRAGPAEVAPVVVNGLKLVARYQQRLVGGHPVGAEALIEALPAEAPTPDLRADFDPRDHAYRWRVVVYSLTYAANKETDVQDDFIQSLARHGDEIDIVSEDGRRFALSLSTHRVSPRP